MVEHIVDQEKCRGCGKCIEKCGLELWELVDVDGDAAKARVVEEAGIVCNCCGFCRDACPEAAIVIVDG